MSDLSLHNLKPSERWMRAPDPTEKNIEAKGASERRRGSRAVWTFGIALAAAPFAVPAVKAYYDVEPVAEGKTGLDVGDFRGKILYLYGFQFWCPGCHSRGFPTLQKLIRHYKDDTDVEFVAVQTVFEGFGTNTFERARKVAKDYGLKIRLPLETLGLDSPK